MPLGVSMPAGKRQHGEEVVNAVSINLESPSFGSGHVLYEGAGQHECDLLRAAVGEKLVCVPVLRQPTYYDLLAYSASALSGKLILLTNPDIVYDSGDVANIRPELINSTMMFTFSVRPPPLSLLLRTTNSTFLASSCEHNPTKVAIDYCFGVGNRCKGVGHIGPCSWDGYLYRAPKLLPPTARRLKFPMNVQAAEAFATGVFRDDLGFQIRQGCHFVRAYNCHCAPKTNQDTTSSWPGRMWNYDLDTMTLNHSLANPMPLLPLTCGERSADLPSDPEGKALTTRCIEILVDKYHRNHGEMETSVVGALHRGEPHVDAACIVLFPPYVECPELGKQRTHEYSRAGSHLSSERPRFGDSRI